MSQGEPAIPTEMSRAVAAMLESIGLGGEFRITPLAGGANNRVFKIVAVAPTATPLVLKQYFQNPGDPRDRLGAEWAFLQYASRQSARWTPKPLAVDREHGLAICEFISGRAVRPGEVTPDRVRLAADFVLALNHPEARPHAMNLANASESCYSLKDHMARIDDRVARLAVIEPADELDREAIQFVQTALAPAWRQLRDETGRQAGLAGLAWDVPIDERYRVVSPSDFGFHNALRREDGQVVFLDFEYAGWDDPAKLAGDFFSQVAVPVPQDLFEDFIARLATLHPREVGQMQIRRSRLLRPVYRLKWCCIVLNEFLPVGQARRTFAGGAGASQTDLHAQRQVRRVGQLAKARVLLSSIDTVAPSLNPSLRARESQLNPPPSRREGLGEGVYRRPQCSPRDDIVSSLRAARRPI